MNQISYRIIPPCSAEQDKLLPLLARCFPDHWGKRPANSPFSYAGTSFTAECGGAFVGHAAIMPQQIEAGDGTVVQTGGLASVAVDPDYRGRGIAEQLCRMAAEYFHERGFAMLTLYTSLYRVYEKSGWKRYENPEAPWMLRGKDSECRVPPGCRAAELSVSDRKRIISAYRSGTIFPGKTFRYEGLKVRHSWNNLFKRMDLRFYLSETGYAVCSGGILEELYAPPPERRDLLASALAENHGELTVAVPHQCLSPRDAEQSGLMVFPGAGTDPMHGESPMIYEFGDNRCPTLSAAAAEHRLYFPAIDKF